MESGKNAGDTGQSSAPLIIFGKMKSKITLILILLLALCAVFSGCGNKNSDNNADNQNGEQTQSPAPKPEFYGGSGTASDPYVIAEGYQWANVSKYPDAHFVLNNDISLAALDKVESIGSASEPFGGTVDGKGYTVSRANVSAKESGGLFGVLSGASIKNLNLENCIVTYEYVEKHSQYYGVLAGQIKNASLIENCHAENVKVVQSSSWGLYNNIGGLVGGAYSFSEILYSSVNMTFVGTEGGKGEYLFGGIAGTVENSRIAGCWADGTVTLTYGSGIAKADSRKIGGLVYEATNAEIVCCYTALDFIDNRDKDSAAALIYKLDSENKVSHNVSFANFRVEPINGEYYSNKNPREDSASVNVYFSQSEGISIDAMNSQIVDGSFNTGFFTEGTLHPVLVDYQTFKELMAVQ